MESFQLKPKRITRKGYEVVYMKEGQDIVDFECHRTQCADGMENIRILKMRNQVNRMSIKTANLENSECIGKTG